MTEPELTPNQSPTDLLPRYTGTISKKKKNQKKKMTVIWRDSTDPTTYDVICCRGIFNQDRPSHRPIAVVKATSPRDVLDAVAISNEQRCQLAVRAGGHSIPVWSLCAESILVDLGGWKEINLQPQSGVVEVTPAVTSEELNQYLTVGFGRMFPGGHCPSVGIGGFVLSGGIGWNARVCLPSNLSVDE